MDLDAKRREKLPACEFCGEAAHMVNGKPVPLMCPRVSAVQYGHDEVTVYFKAAPVIIALKDLASYAEEEA